MRIALGQINPTLGDFSGNLRLIEQALDEAERRGADLLVLTELALSGYPPRDLLERPAFLAAAKDALAALARRVGKTGVVVGFPEALAPAATGRSPRSSSNTSTPCFFKVSYSVSAAVFTSGERS